MNVVANPKSVNDISFPQRKLDLEEQDKRDAEALQKAHKSPFSRFYQVNKENSNFLRSCLKENPRALEMLLFIFDHMDKYNAVVCSYKVFQEALGIKKTTCYNAIKYLQEHGFIAVMKSGTSNVYIANSDLVWNSWGNNRQYCQFPANVVLSRSEQTEIKKVVDKRVTETILRSKN